MELREESPGTRTSTPILEARGITKAFPGVVALDDVSFQVCPGEVHALAGENGSGKSTLIKVLTGVYQPDNGNVFFNDEEVSFGSPREALAAGISTIYQEVNLVPLMTVAENIFLGREPRTRLGTIDVNRMNREASATLANFDIEADVRTPLRSLGLGVQQMVAIARAVSINAQVVIMDEPTSSLEATEVDTLFRVIRQLREQNIGVVFVTHRLEEFYEICDQITVLRDGNAVHSGPLAELPKLPLIATMLGRELPDVQSELTRFEAHHAAAAQPVLVAEGLTRYGVIEDISFEVRPGEVVGFAGLLGSGRTETAKAVFGAMSIDSGTVKIDGKEVKLRSPAVAIKNGLAFMPEDRRAEGIIPGLSVRDNIVSAALPYISHGGLVSRKAADEIVDKFIKALDIKVANPDQPVEQLSGGNQQKVLLARWLCLNVKVLILDEPTRGIDVGAKAEVQRLVGELAGQGLGIVMISTELEEIIEGSDQVVVLKDGQVVATVSSDELTEGNLMRLMAGHDPEQGEENNEHE